MNHPKNKGEKCPTCGRTSGVVDMSKCPFCTPTPKPEPEVVKNGLVGEFLGYEPAPDELVTLGKPEEWWRVIQLNLKCGCALGRCTTCAPLIAVVTTLLERERRIAVNQAIQDILKSL